MENSMKNKRAEELFAYEMTEVLLTLKGEFAAVSGKNTNFTPVDEKKLQLPQVKPVQVKTEAAAAAVPTAQKMPPVKQVQVETEAIAPELPVVQKIPQIKAVKVTTQAAAAQIPVVAPVALIQPKVSLQPIKTDVPVVPGQAVPGKISGLAVKKPEVTVPVAQVAAVDKTVCKVDKIKIGLPATQKPDAPAKVQVRVAKMAVAGVNATPPAVPKIKAQAKSTPAPEIPVVPKWQAKTAAAVAVSQISNISVPVVQPVRFETSAKPVAVSTAAETVAYTVPPQVKPCKAVAKIPAFTVPRVTPPEQIQPVKPQVSVPFQVPAYEPLPDLEMMLAQVLPAGCR